MYIKNKILKIWKKCIFSKLNIWNQVYIYTYSPSQFRLITFQIFNSHHAESLNILNSKGSSPGPQQSWDLETPIPKTEKGEQGDRANTLKYQII